ncbi:MAG: 6'''-hydroxyparomomycin C oxidase [Gemmatimonadaceae bacterium]|nr:6'''-hydroxyparomomycin C oxidase [Gemmatimonadaceae bacterium]
MRPYDAIVVGSGFGGVMAAYPLVMAGQRVLMIERGEWVERRLENWDPVNAHELSRHFSRESTYWVKDARWARTTGSFHCVGGPSVYYGGVALRMRERDFDPGSEILGDSHAAWPFGYAELAPYYDRAEWLLGVAGDDRDDPTAPPRDCAYPQAPTPLTPPSQRVADAARSLGLHPFPLPLAINYREASGRAACTRCATCDGFACAIGAKNDLATNVIPRLMEAGLEVRANTVAVQLTVSGRLIQAVCCVDRSTGAVSHLNASRVILAAGTLATPHLLLASGLDRYSPASDSVGRYLMRHCNLLTMGAFRDRTNPSRLFHKQVAIHDFYFGAQDVDPRLGKLGAIQQITPPGPGYVRRIFPRPIGALLAAGVPYILALMSIAEDEPRAGNRVTIDHGQRDRFGLPLLKIHHRYTRRDVAASRALVSKSKGILRAAGAWATAVHDLRSFSHAVGTVRMGLDEATSPLDETGRFRGLDNLFVADGSSLPTSAGVNPSLTIAANALRIGSLLVGQPLARARVSLPLHAPSAPVHVP